MAKGMAKGKGGVTHVCPEHYGYLLRHEPTACEPIHVNPERSFGGTNGEPPSEASQLPKISKTYIANGAIYVFPELYL